MEKPRLTIELVPSTCWYTNVRSEVSTEEWDKLRRASYRAAKYKCEICLGRGTKHPVECHEVWYYDDIHFIQRLERLISLCPACHQVKHIGLAQVHGKLNEATEHLMRVNGWDTTMAKKYIKSAFQVYERRSEFEWELDITWLEKQLCK